MNTEERIRQDIDYDKKLYFINEVVDEAINKDHSFYRHCLYLQQNPESIEYESLDILAEFAIEVFSKTGVKRIDANGRDYSDGTENKTATARKRTDKNKSVQVAIQGLKNKTGLLRVIAYVSEVEGVEAQLLYYKIPYEIYSRYKCGSLIFNPFTSKGKLSIKNQLYPYLVESIHEVYN